MLRNQGSRHEVEVVSGLSCRGMRKSKKRFSQLLWVRKRPAGFPGSQKRQDAHKNRFWCVKCEAPPPNCSRSWHFFGPALRIQTTPTPGNNDEIQLNDNNFPQPFPAVSTRHNLSQWVTLQVSGLVRDMRSAATFAKRYARNLVGRGGKRDKGGAGG